VTSATTTAVWVVDVARSFRAAFFMFWETLWPLVLGFGLSGAVQAFVGHASIQRKLGNHRPAAVVRASGYGMASSSCSYAASAMAKSLFAKGADFLSAMVFMVASTNLVIELGVVLVVLMGWQFAASEFVGGTIMIALLVSLGTLYLRGTAITQARQALAEATAHDDRASETTGLQRQPWNRRLRSGTGWTTAATYTMADLTMLRKELAVGYLGAGFLATLVPVHAWNAVFLHGHGFWTSAENVVVGPFIAIITMVCSVGNVPLAAALWRGGISFGGVVSFIFADLIALPLLLVYRRYYGTELTLRMLALLWTAMAAAGLATEGLFTLAGLVPSTRPGSIAPDHFQWNATTYLNLVSLAVFGLLYRLYRNRGGGTDIDGFAIDPVCGMQVETANAPATAQHEGVTLSFCSDRCGQRFTADSSPRP
jgi:hypothetical protein